MRPATVAVCRPTLDRESADDRLRRTAVTAATATAAGAFHGCGPLPDRARPVTRSVEGIARAPTHALPTSGIEDAGMLAAVGQRLREGLRRIGSRRTLERCH